jgi:hypothetical protein
MDKKKVTDLARSYSLSCKKLVKDKQLMGTLTSPAVMMIALTVMTIVSTEVGIDKRGWGVA